MPTLLIPFLYITDGNISSWTTCHPFVNVTDGDEMHFNMKSFSTFHTILSLVTIQNENT